MDVIVSGLQTLLSTTKDVLPIVLFIIGFQVFVIRRPLPHVKQLATGIVLVILGLALFLIGLEQSLFPLGEKMARLLTSPAVLGEGSGASAYMWVYLFAVAIGFSTTIAEPSLLAVALKANETSGGAISVWGLRVAVAIGVSIGVGLGCFRIVTGTPLHYYIIVGYIVVVLQTIKSPKLIIPLAYDSGGVTTSTVTVPLVTALGLGLAGAIPGRSTLLDGFGLIAFASLFPIISVLGYAQVTEAIEKRRSAHEAQAEKFLEEV